MDKKVCIIRKTGFGGWFLQHPADEAMGWSGSAWVPVTDDGYFAGRGLPAGDTQVCNFSDVCDAVDYVETHGFKLVAIVSSVKGV